MRPIATDRVAWSVGLSDSVCYDREPCKSIRTERDAIRDVDSNGPRKHVLHEVQIAHVKRQFWGRKVAGPGRAQTCPAIDIVKATQQVRCRCRFGCITCGCTMALPGEHDWTVRVRRRCGLLLPIDYYHSECFTCVFYIFKKLRRNQKSLAVFV